MYVPEKVETFVSTAVEAIFDDAVEIARLRKQVDDVKTILEELDSIPFVASETGLGMDEAKAWRDRLQADLRKAVGSRSTCWLCGEKYIPGEHSCCWMMGEPQP